MKKNETGKHNKKIFLNTLKGGTVVDVELDTTGSKIDDVWNTPFESITIEKDGEKYVIESTGRDKTVVNRG